MGDKILSVIIPSYNMEAYLPKCLGSLMVDDKGLFQKLDIIVVNDGSKDRTSEIAHEFELRYPNVFRVLDKANGNYGSCINAALPIAKGVFVKILDADDSFDTEAFAKMLTVMRESEFDADQVDLFLTDFVEVDETGSEKVLRTIQLPSGKTLNIDAVDCIPLLYMHSIAYRTENLRSMKYRQTEGISYTDTEWTYYPMSAVKRFRYEPFTVYRYLVGRVGQTIDPKVRKKAIWTCADIAKRMVKEFHKISVNVPQVIKRYLEDFAVMMCAKAYNGTIMDLHDNVNDQKLMEFDANLKSMSGLIYNRLMEQLVSRKIGFKYGWYWSEYKTSNTFKLKIFRLYVRAVLIWSNLYCHFKQKC